MKTIKRSAIFEVCPECNGNARDNYSPCYKCLYSGEVLTELAEAVMELIENKFHVVRKPEC